MKHNSSAEMAPRWCRSDNTDGRGGRRRHNISSLLGHVAVSLLLPLLALLPAAAWADDDTQSYDTLFHFEVTASTSLSTTDSTLTYGKIAASAALTASTQQNAGGAYALTFSANTTYLTITLADCLAAGDSIIMYGGSATSGVCFALCPTTTRSTDIATTGVSAVKTKDTLTYTIPSGSSLIGLSTIYVFRGTGNTTYFCGATIIRAKSETTSDSESGTWTISPTTGTLTEPLTTITLTSSDSISAVNTADSCTVTITKDGSSVNDITPTLSLGTASDDGYCYTATVSFGDNTSIETNGTYTITIPAGALMTITEKQSSSDGEATTTAEGVDEETTTDKVEYDTTFSEKIELTYTISIAGPTVTVAKQVSTAKSLAKGDTLLVLTFDQAVTKAASATATLTSSDETSYDVTLALTTDGDSAVVTLDTEITTDATYTLTISSGAFTTTNWSSDELTYIITVSSKETFYLVADDDNAQTNGITITPASGTTSLTLDNIVITLPAAVTYNGSNAITVDNATASVTADDTLLTIALSSIKAGQTITITIPAGAITYTSDGTTYTNAAATLTYTVPAVTVVDSSQPSTYSWDFDDSSWSGFSVDASSSSTDLSSTSDGLTVYAASGKKTYVNTSTSITIGGTSHAAYLNIPAGGTNNGVSFQVTGPCTIYVGACSSSSSESRKLFLSDGSTTLTSFETVPYNSTTISEFSYSYTGSSGNLYLYSYSSGQRIYYITIVYASSTALDFKAITPDPAVTQQSMSSIQLTYDNSILYAGQGDSGISVTKKTDTDGTAETVTSSYAITSSDDNAYHYLTISFDEITYSDEDTTYVTLSIPEKTFCGSDYVSTAAVDTTFTIAKVYLVPTAVTPESGTTTSLLSSVALTFDSLAYYDSTAGSITVKRSDSETVDNITVSPATSADADTTITISFGNIETEDITVTVTIPAGCLTTAAGTANKELTYTYTIQEESETKDESWNFSNWTATNDYTSGTTTDGLTVTASSTIVIETVTATVGGTSYTKRLKLPSGGSFSFDVTAQCVITVVAKSGSSSEDREYVVYLNGDSISTGTAYGSTATSATHYCAGAGTVTITNVGKQINYYEIYLTYIDGLSLTNVVPEDNSTVESLSKIYIYYDEAIQLTDQPRATYRVDGTLAGTYGTDVTLQVSSSNNQCLVATVPTTAAESGKTKTAKLTIRSYSVANSDSTSLNEDPIVLDYTLQFLPLNIVEVSPDTTTNPSFVKYVYVTYDSENDLTLNDSKSVSVTVNGSAYTGTVETSVSGKKLKITLSQKVNTNSDVVVITLPDSIVSDNGESYNTEESLTYNINAYGELCSFYFTTSLSTNANTTGVSEDDTSTDAVANGCTGSWSGISLTDTVLYSGMKYYKFNTNSSYVKIVTDGGLQAGDSIVAYIATASNSKNVGLCTKVNGDSITVVASTITTSGEGVVVNNKLTSSMLSDGTLTLYRAGSSNSHMRFHGISIYRLGITDPSVTIETDYTERYVNESVEITSELTDFDSENENYQWYSFHGTDSTAANANLTTISGATSPNYSYTATTNNDTTSYVVKVTYETESGKDTTLVSNVLTIITSGYAKPVINTYISGALTEAEGELNDTTTYITSQSAFTVVITSRVSSDNVTYYYKTSTTGFDTEYDVEWTEKDTISMSISTTAITYLSVAAVYGSGTDQVVTYSFALYVPSGGSWGYDDTNVITKLYTDLDDMKSAPLGVKLTYALNGTTYNANGWGLMTLSIEDDYNNAGYYYSNIVTLDADTVIAEMEGTTYITVTLADVTGKTASGSPYEITVYANLEPEIVLTSVTSNGNIETSSLTSYYTLSSDGCTYTMSSGVTAVKFEITMPDEITSSTTNTDTYHIFYTINAPHPTWDTSTEGDKSVYYGSYSTSDGYNYNNNGTREISRSLTSYVKAVYYKAVTVSSDSVTYSKPSNTQLAAFVMPSNYVMTLQTGDSLRAGAEWFITDEETQQYYWSGTMSTKNPKASETSTTESCDTLLRVTWGGTGDLYSSKEGIWDIIREDTKSMMSSQIGDYNVDCEGNKDAKNEPQEATLTDGSTFTNIYKTVGTGSTFYSDTLTNPNTFDIPVTGCYMKIEPRQDGEVSVIVRQNGIITTTKDNFPTNLRKRKIYVSDETGAPLDSTLTAFISPDALQESGIYNTYTSAGWDSLAVNDADNLEFYQMLAYYRWKRGQGNTDVPPAVSDSLKWTTAQKLAAAKFWFGTIDGKQIADSTDTSQLIGGSYTNQTRKDSCAMYQKSHNELFKDNKGWLLMSRAFVRYSFPVEAGKAYFLSGNTTKIGPCAVEFHPRRSGETYEKFTKDRLLTLSDSTETADASTSLPKILQENGNDAYDYGQSKFQLLNRTFYKNGWTSIVLPFSVNTELLERTFGDSTLVVHYNGHDGSTLLLCQHYHQMIVAGTPVFIRPSLKWWQADGSCSTKDRLSDVIFDGISYGTPTYTTDSNDEWQISNQTEPSETVTGKTSGEYTMNGSYIQQSLGGGCYVLGFKLDSSGSAGEASFYSVAEGYILGGCRAWLEPTSSSAVRLTSVSFNGVTDFDDDETTGIIGIMTDDGATTTSRTTHAAYNDNVYNVNGQLVRTAEQGTDGLPAGIYIVNGKKVIIK